MNEDSMLILIPSPLIPTLPYPFPFLFMEKPRIMEASLEKHHFVGDDHEDIGSCSSFGEDDDNGSLNSIGSSSSSDLMEDASSSSSATPEEGPVYDMTSLIAQLPFKRGLSKHFEGKSQSFASLSSVRSLEDLVKPERAVKKKMKTCKSYGGGLDCGHKALSPKYCSRGIAKKSSRGSLSLLGGRKPSFSGSRPPVPPQRSASHTLLFA